MSRDRQLPSLLSKISSRQVPIAAILAVSAISLVLVLFFVGQIVLISSLVNFGALFGFALLHVSVVWYYMGRKKSMNYLLHLVVPTLGFLIIGYVLFNADALAKIGGIVWLGIGAVVFVVNKFRGRGVPRLADEPAVPGEGVSPVIATGPFVGSPMTAYALGASTTVATWQPQLSLPSSSTSWNATSSR